MKSKVTFIIAYILKKEAPLLLDERFDSGNLPTVVGDRTDQHVHWCHGASGLPALCQQAAAACGDGEDTLRCAALS